MNKVLLALTLIIFSGFGLAAANSDQRLQRMTDKLALTAAQAAQVAAIMESQQAKREDLRQQMEALRADTRSQMSTVLSEEQLQKFDRFYQRKKGKQQRLRSKCADQAAGDPASL